MATYQSGHKGKITGPDWSADVKTYEITRKNLVFDSTVLGTGAGVGRTYTLGIDESEFSGEVVFPNSTVSTYANEGSTVAAVLYLVSGAGSVNDKLTGTLYIDQIVFREAVDDLVRATIRGFFQDTDITAGLAFNAAS